MQVEDLLEMTACLRVFKLPNFEARGELALGFWRHINPRVTYKKLMLQSYFLARDHFYICDLIVLGFNDTSTLVGHFVSSPREGRKETEEIVEEMKERNRKERGTGMIVKKQKK